VGVGEDEGERDMIFAECGIHGIDIGAGSPIGATYATSRLPSHDIQAFAMVLVWGRGPYQCPTKKKKTN
jgi:hypothetical protein